MERACRYVLPEPEALWPVGHMCAYSWFIFIAKSITIS